MRYVEEKLKPITQMFFFTRGKMSKNYEFYYDYN